MSGPLVEATDLSRSFRSRSGETILALADVSLRIERGRFVVVTGPSGGGKSTLLALLSALDRPTAGRVVFDGQDLSRASDAELSRVRRRVGFVFQQPSLLRRLCAWENVAAPLVPRGVPEPARRERALALLERVGLASRARSRAEELSGGEMQRVGVARALVAEPAAVFADEPTAHLDRASAEAVTSLFREAHAAGTTFVVATHDPVLVAAAGERILLEGGRLRRS